MHAPNDNSNPLPPVPLHLQYSSDVVEPKLALSATDRLPDLAGFDMVAAVSQDTLNFQLKKLWQSGTIRRELRLDVPDLGIALDAILDAPKVKLGIADERRTVLFTLHLARGTLRYWEGFGPNAKERSLEFAGWRYAFRVRMDMQAIERSAIEAGKAVPADVREKLSAFRDDMFSIRRLFMDFQSADLADFDPRESAMPLPDGSPAGAGVIGRLKDALAVHFKTLAGSDNPYVLGYSVERRRDAADPPALFAPTSATFSTFRDADDGRSALNFLLMLGGATAPSSPLAGLFHDNWIASPDYDGRMVIAAERFRERYILGQLLPAITESIRHHADSPGFVAVTSREDIRAKLRFSADDAGREAFDRSFGGVDDAPGWALYAYRDNLDRDDAPHDRGYGKIVGRDSGMINIYREEHTATSFHLRALPGPDVAFCGRGNAWMTWHFYEYPLNIRTWLGGIDVKYNFGFDARLVAGVDGRITVATHFTDNTPTTWHDTNVLVKLTDIFTSLFNASLGPRIERSKQMCAEIQGSIVRAIEDALKRRFEALGIPVIMPAGSVFYYKNASVDAASNVLFDISYKRDH